MFTKNKLVLNLLLGFIFVLFTTTHSFADASKFGPYLKRVMEQTDSPVPIIVNMRAVPALPQNVWGDEITEAYTERYLKYKTLESQWGMRELISQISGDITIQGLPMVQRIKFFWISNSMMATAAPEAIWHLADRPEVENIFLDTKVNMFREPMEFATSGDESYTYGLERIRVPDLRANTPGLTGKGVVVGIIDTGIDADHPELKGRTIAFKDFVGTGKDAYDDHGHGTHVAGTIGGTGVGGTQIGVAPEVKFVIAKVFTKYGSGTRSGIMRAMEWAANPDGNVDTNDKPQVINNSWGGPLGGDANKDPYFQVVMNWVNLNIFPSFAAGNSGPRKSTLGTPGGLPVAFAVGATNSDDEIASFSSRGPVKITVDGQDVTYIKPDVSAPGYQVLSSMPGGGYGKMSGTSMAAPHNSGVVALMMQAFPEATVAQVRTALMTSSADFGEEGMDNDFGMGRIDSVAATEALGAIVQGF